MPNEEDSKPVTAPTKPLASSASAPVKPAVREPSIGDSVLYWAPKRDGAPFVPFSQSATVAGVMSDIVRLSVQGRQGRFRAEVPRGPRAAHPGGGWSWPEP